jgi:spore germination protein YaaH
VEYTRDMKKTLWIIILIGIIGTVGYFLISFAKEKVRQDLARPIPYPTATLEPPTPTPDVSTVKETNSIFVPYWTLKTEATDSAKYDRYIYFGVVPTKDGINKKEEGSLAVDTFVDLIPDTKERLLTIRMIDNKNNFAILEDDAAQKKVIKDSIALAKAKGFNGIVLDLEVSAIPFDSLVKQITTFNTRFAKQTKQNGLSYSIALYGDVFYRARPFDVKNLAKQADHVLIMAYDLSKAKGDPGPNFPLHGRKTYGYDLERMIDQYLEVVPAKKLTVIFGLFGYDWVVNGQGSALQQGKSLSTHDIETKYVDNCISKNCLATRDSDATETEIHYGDRSGNHIIWYEDSVSVDAKKEFLKQRGVTSFSFWAYSYF